MSSGDNQAVLLKYRIKIKFVWRLSTQYSVGQKQNVHPIDKNCKMLQKKITKKKPTAATVIMQCRIYSIWLAPGLVFRSMPTSAWWISHDLLSKTSSHTTWYNWNANEPEMSYKQVTRLQESCKIDPPSEGHLQVNQDTILTPIASTWHIQSTVSSRAKPQLWPSSPSVRPAIVATHRPIRPRTVDICCKSFPFVVQTRVFYGVWSSRLLPVHSVHRRWHHHSWSTHNQNNYRFPWSVWLVLSIHTHTQRRARTNTRFRLPFSDKFTWWMGSIALRECGWRTFFFYQFLLSHGIK